MYHISDTQKGDRNMNTGNLEFISLKDFLMLPFINPYSKCVVRDLDSEDKLIEDTLISMIKIKELIAELQAGKYEELQEEYYVSDLMPGVSWDDNRMYYGCYFIYLRRF